MAFIYSGTSRRHGQGQKEQSLKLTAAKVNYIIREKTNNIRSKIIPEDMKVSIRTVNRVGERWMKNKEPLELKKFGCPKKSLGDSNIQLIPEIHKEQNSGARLLEKIIEQRYGRHIPYNAIHQVSLENGLANEDKQKKRNAGSLGSDTNNEGIVSQQSILIGIPVDSMEKRSAWFLTIALDSFLQVENFLLQLPRTTWLF